MPFPLTFPVVFSGTSTPFDVAGTLINDAAVELGLAAGTAVDPFASRDGNFIQLCRLLKSVGRDLWRERPWTQLQKEHTFTTEDGVSAYALPADFGAYLNQTGWNRSTRFPLGGPLSPQEWQYLKGRTVNSVLRVQFRPMQQQLVLYPDTQTPAGNVIAYEYISRFWVQSASADSPDKDAPTSADDIVWFDPQLVVRALKLAFRKAKGLDTTAAQQDYERTLELVSGDDSFMPVLNLEGSGLVEPLLGPWNLPTTGIGG